MGLALRIAPAALLAVLAAPSFAAASYDDLGAQSLGGSPHMSAATFDGITPTFDTSGYDEQPEELASPTVYLGCSAAGTKTAWVSFSTAVAGNLRVIVGSDHDIFYKVYGAPLGSSVFAEISEQGCINARHGVGGEEYVHGHEIAGPRTVHVQVLSVCSDGPDPPPPCANPEVATGGPTTVRLRFTPKNADGDSLPDTRDGCPTVAGVFRGCPDSDGDEVGDADDRCPSVPGKGPDGCRLPDEDGDGYNATAGDCDDDDPAIHPGARDVPGNRVDEDCRHGDAKYPRLKSDVDLLEAFSRSRGRSVGFLRPFTVAGPLVKGMKVRLRCQGKGCPFSSRTVRVRKRRAKVKIGAELALRVLAPGARVTLSITRPGYVGKAMRFTVRRRGKLKLKNLCIPPGQTKPKRC